MLYPWIPALRYVLLLYSFILVHDIHAQTIRAVQLIAAPLVHMTYELQPVAQQLGQEKNGELLLR